MACFLPHILIAYNLLRAIIMNEFNASQRPMPLMGGRPQLGFMEAVKICLTKKYCCFKGRARRSEFWWFVLAQQIVSTVVGTIASFAYLATHSIKDYLNDPLGLLTSPGFIVSEVVMLALLLPYLGVCVRRLHDTNHSGWWMLVLLSIVIPIVGALAMVAFTIVFIVWACQDSDRGENAYGRSPKYQ